MRICVFAGANPGRSPHYLQAARDLGTAIAGHGLGVVYGGASVGLMGACADAALEAGGEVIGVLPRALDRREVAHKGLSVLHIVESLHERKAKMHALSGAFVALPGGAGTLDELFEALTWRQLGLHGKPIGLLDVHGYWAPLLASLAHMVGEGFLPAPLHESLLVHTNAADLVEALLATPPAPVGRADGTPSA